MNFKFKLGSILGLRVLVNCLVKIANDLDEEMSTEPRTEKSRKSIGDILLENGHICNSPSGKSPGILKIIDMSGFGFDQIRV